MHRCHALLHWINETELSIEFVDCRSVNKIVVTIYTYSFFVLAKKNPITFPNADEAAHVTSLQVLATLHYRMSSKSSLQWYLRGFRNNPTIWKSREVRSSRRHWYASLWSHVEIMGSIFVL